MVLIFLKIYSLRKIYNEVNKIFYKNYINYLRFIEKILNNI